MIIELLIIILQIYFILMNVTVEKCYCEGPFKENDDRFLIKETIEFCQENNKLFLARPDWMVQATCISAYVLIFGYLLTLISAITKQWKTFAIPLLLFIGIKINAIFFYHYMEFTSSTPPENLIPYFSVEGPYILSMLLVIYKVTQHLYHSNKNDNKKKV